LYADRHAGNIPPMTGAALLDDAREYVREQVSKEALSFVLHAVALLMLVTWLRPVLNSPIPAQAYEAKSVIEELLTRDITILTRAAKRHRPQWPRLLFLLVPTVAFIVNKANIGWDRFEHGKALRWFVMAWLFPLVWAGSTFSFNYYLGQGHFLDRFLLISFFVASWRSPLFVPFAARIAFIMMHEIAVPLGRDHFDWESVYEVLCVFSVFTWFSFIKSFHPKHFLLVGLGHWAAYYFWAGMAKHSMAPDWAWVTENHLSNLSMGAYVRGYLNFIPEDSWIAFNEFVRKFDTFLAVFTMVMELGALVFFHLHRQTVRVWAILGAMLNGGIFLLTGIFFWKWIIANIALYLFATRPGGRELINAMSKHKLATVLAALSIYYANHRIWYRPKTGVRWWDTRLVEDYELYAIGDSGERYHINPTWLEPHEMKWIMGQMCYATNERKITGIYATTGSRSVFRALENAKKPEDAIRLNRRGRRCTNPRKRKVKFDDYFKRYFTFINAHGRPHRWLTWLGRPKHLMTNRQGDFYDLQEPVKRIELYRELVFHHDHKLYRMDRRKVHQVDIPR
jgi:hypothetical protein